MNFDDWQAGAGTCDGKSMASTTGNLLGNNETGEANPNRGSTTMKTHNSFATTTCPNTLAGCLRTSCAARLLPLLLLLLLPAVVQAQDYTYTTNDDNTITITGYIGSGGDVTIPDTINGLPVTGIGDYAFYDCDSLSSVTIPNSVTSIGDDAFAWCTSLTNVIIPDNVTSIGGCAFASCYSLSSVTIPNSVTSIGIYSFDSCRSLTSATIGNSVTSIGGWTFDNCKGLSSVTIGNSVTSIMYSAFAGCTSLSSVTIPHSVTSIGHYAFAYCTGLTNVMIGNSVTSIGIYAFAVCTNLSSITIPNNITSIGSCAFWFCPSLTSVYFQGNAPIFIGQSVFSESRVNETIYYLPGTTGWSTTFGGRPTVPWYLPNPLILNGPSFGVQTNGFGFIISWATNISVVVEACTNFVNPVWQSIQTNTLISGWCYFSDPDWANYPVRFYRLCSP